MKWEEMIGKKFGMLTVLCDAGRTNAYNRKLVCRCNCGNETVVLADNLRKGHTTSCGCYKNKVITDGANTIHGGRYTRLYEIWRSMRQRCSNPNKSNYQRYGGSNVVNLSQISASYKFTRMQKPFVIPW